MINFIQSKEKFNFNKLSLLNTTPIINLYGNLNYPNIEPIIQKYSSFDNLMHSYELGLIYGKPNSIIRECENSPGVWVFNFSNNITLLMFSDGFRKNNYKGTSFELVINDNINGSHAVDALDFFFNDAQSKLKLQFPDNYNQIKSLKLNF